MIKLWLLALAVLVSIVQLNGGVVRRDTRANHIPSDEEKRAWDLVLRSELRYERALSKKEIASWNYGSNLTEYNLIQSNRAQTEYAETAKSIANELRQFQFKAFRDADLKRRFSKLTKLQYYALPEENLKELLTATSGMMSNYAKIKVCSYKDKTKCNLSLEPEISEIFSSSRDPEELKYYWLEWYNRAGTRSKDNFIRYTELNKEAAVLNGFANGADSWLSEYDDETFEQQVEGVIQQIKPLYEQIHGYVRFKLNQKYGSEVVSPNGPIPMHLLGNLWAQTWENVADITAPFPTKKLLDVTEEMVKQGYTPLKMFQMGDDFFQSLNMTKLPQTFWERSILQKPTDGRDLVCHASAWYFFQPDDVRIKQCTLVKMHDFFVAHHELGHIQYYLQYQHQPPEYRFGANPGFHEAVGDVLSLSVSTPKHLIRVGLLKDHPEDEQDKINRFYRAGITKFVFLPFAYTLDKYRWSFFRGEIKPENYNCHFWQLRSQYSGIEPPVVRSERDFDPPAKYHLSADVEYLRYFVSYVVQFQFHKAACILAGEYVPGDPEKTLNNCDIYQSAAAGEKIKAMLSLGSSKPWPDAMEVLTGERKMSADALLEYFKPLSDWLTAENKRLGAPIGWTTSDKCIRRPQFDFLSAKK